MPDNLRFCIHVDNIPPEGIVSQIFDLGLSFHFLSKNGSLFSYFSEYLFLYFLKIEPRPISKI